MANSGCGLEAEARGLVAGLSWEVEKEGEELLRN
jgi:hypothetical protein